MKYEITDVYKIHGGTKLFQIKALKDFGGVRKGDLGGWIESEYNLSQSGNAWVSSTAKVSGNAKVSGDAWVYGNAWVYGDARVSGSAKVYGDARVSGNAWVYGDARVSDNAWVYGDVRIPNADSVFWISNIGSEHGTLTAFRSINSIEITRGCFNGSLEKFAEAVEETHGNSKIGQEYRLIIELIKVRLGGDM